MKVPVNNGTLLSEVRVATVPTCRQLSLGGGRGVSLVEVSVRLKKV